MTKAVVLAAILRLMGPSASAADVQHAETLAPIILEQSEAFGFDPRLTVALIDVESRFNPHARNEATGAVGAMQILRGGAVPEWLEYMADAELMAPRRNLTLGLQALSRYRERCKTLSGALSRYDGRRTCHSSTYSRRVLLLYQMLTADTVHSSS